MLFGSKTSQVIAAQSSQWRPRMVFFRRRSATVSLAGHNSTHVTWRFQSIGDGRLPFHFLRCELVADGITAIGQGYDARLSYAMRQALAEAWERLWVHRPAPARLGFILSAPTSSNGYAAGPDNISAMEASRAELIERAIMLTAWRSMRGWRPYRVESLVAGLLCSGLSAGGWGTTLFELRDENLGSVLAALARHPTKGAIFDSVFVGNRKERRILESKVLRSITRAALARRTQNLTDDGTKREFPEIGGPEDQARFYLAPANGAAFEFLDDPWSQTGAVQLPDPDDIRTTLLCCVSEMPAVAVSTHPGWPTLSWGKSSIQGENTWPHPLA